MKYTSTEEYISLQDPSVQPVLKQMRELLEKTVPQGKECISYNMPAIRTDKVLVYYAACRGHLGFYPTPGPIEAFQQELRPYHTSKGAVQFPYDAVPWDLIAEMVRYRMKEEA